MNPHTGRDFVQFGKTESVLNKGAKKIALLFNPPPVLSLVIIYTLENLERHPDIDGIEVVCLEGWHEVLRAYARQYGIGKLKWIVSGGGDGQESTQRGVEALGSVCRAEDIVIIHDAIRPFIPQQVISDAIRTCQRWGSGLSAVRCQETIVRTDDGVSGAENIGRQEIMRVQTPQAYKYKKALWAYEEAGRRGIKGEKLYKKCRVVCFVVSDMEGNPAVIDGVPVVSLDEFTKSDRFDKMRVQILVTAPENHHDRILCALGNIRQSRQSAPALLGRRSGLCREMGPEAGRSARRMPEIMAQPYFYNYNMFIARREVFSDFCG